MNWQPGQDRITWLQVNPHRTMTTKKRLVFFNARQTEMVTAFTKALYRDLNDVMVYESVDQVLKRINDRNLIDLDAYQLARVEDYN